MSTANDTARPGAVGAANDARTDAAGVAPHTRGLPRLLAGIPGEGALDLRQHLELHGEQPPRRGRGRGPEPELIEEVRRAGLRGRGGGGFPTGAKLSAVAQAGRGTRGRRPIVLVNAAESEPASEKDRTLLSALPHLVLDGGELAARAVGAQEIAICVCETATRELRAIATALSERSGLAGGAAAHTRVVAVPDRYVASQESALVNRLNGGPALPTFTPPLPFQRGVGRRPTLVSNAETVAHVALIARHGARWFRALGTAAQPGSALVTLCGPVRRPGVYEIEYGSPLSALVQAAGGLYGEVRAALFGGYAGSWIDAAALPELMLADERLAAHGATLGAGVVALISDETCPVAELARLVRWLAGQSARQCGPCTFGLPALADTVERIALGAAGGEDPRARLAALAALVRRRGACGHPDGVARLVDSALRVFAAELAQHASEGPCAACARPSELPRPRGASDPSRPLPARQRRATRASRTALGAIGAR